VALQRFVRDNATLNIDVL